MLKQLCDPDGKELLQWRCNKEVYQSQFKEWLVTWTLTNLSVFSQALLITHHRLMEHRMEIQGAREEGVAEQLKEDKAGREEITEILSEIWKTALSKKGGTTVRCGIENWVSSARRP